MSPPPITIEQCAAVPPYLTEPLPAPERRINHNRGLLDLLADYELLRRRANADRETVADLRAQPGSAGED